MEVTPIPGTLPILTVTPVKRVGQARKGANSARTEEPDKPIPEPAPGTGELLDLYV